MLLLYALLLMGTVFGVSLLLRRRRSREMKPGRKRYPMHRQHPLANEGGNSSRDEQENLATTGDNTGGSLPLGADNDDDRIQ